MIFSHKISLSIYFIQRLSLQASRIKHGAIIQEEKKSPLEKDKIKVE